MYWMKFGLHELFYIGGLKSDGLLEINLGTHLSVNLGPYPTLSSPNTKNTPAKKNTVDPALRRSGRRCWSKKDIASPVPKKLPGGSSTEVLSWSKKAN